MPLFKYEAVVAKCKCLYGKLLNLQDYENLLRCADISDMAVYLNDNTAYGEFLEGFDLKKIRRNKLEYYIKKSMLSDYLKMYKFTFGSQRRFISLLMAKYEFDYILRIWRDYVLKNTEKSAVLDENDEDDYVFNEKFLEIQAIYQNNPRIALDVLKNINTAEQFLDAIRNTEYFYIFEKHMNDDISKNYTEIETAVYDEYYKILYDGAKIFDKDTEEKIRDSISTQVDLINLCRISRLMFNFKTKPEKITPLLVPLENKLKSGDINALLRSENKDAFLSYCQSNLYYGKKQSFRDYNSMDEYMNAFLYKYYKSKISIASLGFDIIVCYFRVKEFELMNLFYLTEGIRYKIAPEYMRKYMYGLDYTAERGRT